MKFNDLTKQWQEIKKTTEPKILSLLESGQYVHGPLVENFENKFARYCGTDYAIGVSNGTDALKLSIEALDLSGNVNVLIPANTFISDIFAISYQRNANYEVSLIDCNEYYQIDVDLVESHLAENRDNFDHCILLPVHLYGHPSDMKKICELAEKYKCYIIEDGSQAHGARCYGKSIGVDSDMCAFSLYPGKNLGAAGDAGIITCNKTKYNEKLRSLRNLGSTQKYFHEVVGWNNRLDPIQAVILEEKLNFLNQWVEEKSKIAKKYDAAFLQLKNIEISKTATYVDTHGHHLYVIRVKNKNREKLINWLKKDGIPTIIHYPILIQDSDAYKQFYKSYDCPNATRYSKEILSLPLHPYLSNQQSTTIIDSVVRFDSEHN